MQEFEPEDFTRQVMEGSIEHNLKQISESVKKHLNLIFNKISQKYPDVISISWQQDSKPYVHKYELEANQMNYFDRKNKKDMILSGQEYVQEGTKIIHMKTKDRYSLFADQIQEESNKMLEFIEKLDSAVEIFSEELKKINPLVLLLVFGQKVKITVTQDKFNYLYAPIPVETCDG